jgi:hypothetical protein
MKLKAVHFAVFFVTLMPVLAQSPPALRAQFDEAERRIVRLPPTAFPELPGNVVTELQRRGCTIPQEVFTEKRNNVIHGEFAKPGQTDWAVLCSVNGVSSILVFWGGTAKDPAQLAAHEDRIYLQGIDEHRIGFGRSLSVVGRAFIVDHYQAYGGQKPPAIDHQGLNDAFIEKASVVHYFFRGKWLELQGAD